MGKWDAAKRLTDAGRARLNDVDIARVAGDAVIGAKELADGAEAVARRSGLTKKNGELSKVRIAKALVTPQSSARRVLDATADEVRSRRGAPPADPDSAGS